MASLSSLLEAGRGRRSRLIGEAQNPTLRTANRAGNRVPIGRRAPAGREAPHGSRLRRRECGLRIRSPRREGALAVHSAQSRFALEFRSSEPPSVSPLNRPPGSREQGRFLSVCFLVLPVGRQFGCGQSMDGAVGDGIVERSPEEFLSLVALAQGEEAMGEEIGQAHGSRAAANWRRRPSRGNSSLLSNSCQGL